VPPQEKDTVPYLVVKQPSFSRNTPLSCAVKLPYEHTDWPMLVGVNGEPLVSVTHALLEKSPPDGVVTDTYVFCWRIG
jgi:hypothetical protein